MKTLGIKIFSVHEVHVYHTFITCSSAENASLITHLYLQLPSSMPHVFYN